MPVDAVDARVQLAADPPLPERRVRRVEDRVPLPVPGEELGVLLEALREVLLCNRSRIDGSFAFATFLIAAGGS